MSEATLKVSTITRVLGGMAVVGALLLVASLFLDWYEVDFGFRAEAGGTVSYSGWDAFELADALFVIILGLVVWLAIFPPALDTTRRSSLLLIAICTAVVVAILMTTSTPTLAQFEPEAGASVSLEEGAFLGAAGAALLLLAGGFDAALRVQARRTPARGTSDRAG